MSWEAVWRDMNVVLSGLGLVLMIHWYIRYRTVWAFQEREALRALIVLLAGALFGSLWGAIAGFDFNIGMVFVTLGSLHAIQAALRAPARYADVKPSPPLHTTVIARLRESWRRE